VSKFLIQSHSPDHVLSCSAEHQGVELAYNDEKPLPGDIIGVLHDISKFGTIEWISPDGKFWVHLKGTVDGEMVSMNAHDLRIEPAPHTLSFSKDKGYNVAVGDVVEVARGKWYRSQGVVKTVDLTKACLEIVCSADGNQVSCPFILIILAHHTT